MNKQPVVEPTEPPTVTIERPNRKLDVLFVLPTFMRDWLPAAVRQRMPRFLETLAGGAEGMPDLHLGVVSAAMGAGVFSAVAGCVAETGGDEYGWLKRGRPCSELAEEARFLTTSADGVANNFTGDIADAAACMMNINFGTCGVLQPLAAARRALEKAADPGDPETAASYAPTPRWR